MLRYLLDENISPVVAREMHRKHRQIPIESLHLWKEGVLLGQPDPEVLREAHASGLTLVTYDQGSIPAILLEWAHLGLAHSGVIFVSQRSIPAGDFGMLIRGLGRFWEANRRHNWRGRVGHLTATDF